MVRSSMGLSIEGTSCEEEEATLHIVCSGPKGPLNELQMNGGPSQCDEDALTELPALWTERE